jgi:hypothetical protein
MAEAVSLSGGAFLKRPTEPLILRQRRARLARQAIAAFGGVHLLFNNARVGAGGPPWEATWNDWEWVIGVNLWGVIHRPPDLRNEALTMSPDLQAGLAAFKAAIQTSMPPLEVADVVFEAIKKEQFYILTHPEWIEVIQLRTDKLLRMENPQSPAATIAKVIKARGS